MVCILFLINLGVEYYISAYFASSMANLVKKGQIDYP